MSRRVTEAAHVPCAIAIFPPPDGRVQKPKEKGWCVSHTTQPHVSYHLPVFEDICNMHLKLPLGWYSLCFFKDKAQRLSLGHALEHQLQLSKRNENNRRKEEID